MRARSSALSLPSRFLVAQMAPVREKSEIRAAWLMVLASEVKSTLLSDLKVPSHSWPSSIPTFM